MKAVIIEDKVGPKRNSLSGTDIVQIQEDIDTFAYKISRGKKAQVSEDFMIIVRIESFIAGKGVSDAIERAKTYIDVGADSIMIHSNEKGPVQIFAFCDEYSKFDRKVPLVVVPSTFSQVTESQLIDAGVQIVIYANHLLRSAYPAMVKTAESILRNGRAREAEELCTPIKDILSLIPFRE